MRPNKVETAVQCSVCRMWEFAGFSGHGNLIYIYIYIYIIAIKRPTISDLIRPIVFIDPCLCGLPKIHKDGVP